MRRCKDYFFYKQKYKTAIYQCAVFTAVAIYQGFPGGLVVESTCLWRRHRFNPWVAKTPRRRKWQPPLLFLSGKFYGQWSLASYSPRGCKESDTTGQARMQRIINTIPFSLKKIVLSTYTCIHHHTHSLSSFLSLCIFSITI